MGRAAVVVIFAFGEVEQIGDIWNRKPLDPQKLAVRECV